MAHSRNPREFCLPVLFMGGHVSVFNCSVLTPVLVLLKKWLGINKWGKRIKRKIQILLRLVRQVVRAESRVTQRLLQNDYSTGFKAIYLTFLI